MFEITSPLAFLDCFVSGQSANLILLYGIRDGTGVGARGGLDLSTLGRGKDVYEFLSIYSRGSRVNDERHPACPRRPWVPPCVIRAPLDDGVTRIFEVGLRTIRENQDDFPGYCHNESQPVC